MPDMPTPTLRNLGVRPLVLPLPAVLVATWNVDGTANAMTAAWATSCCQEPPCAGVAVRGIRLTHENLVHRGAFTLAVPPTRLARQVDYLGLVSGKREPDKLERLGLRTAPGPAADAPLLLDCPVNVACRLLHRLDLGTHTWFVGQVVEIHADPACVREDGTLDIAAVDPLAYASSASTYHGLGPALGRAFSLGKERPPRLG